MDGVLETTVGYAGGTTIDPDYQNIGDHMESVRVRYDPAVISYEQLLDFFWAEHDHTARPWSRQYMNAVLYSRPEQKQTALGSASRLKGTVRTEIMELDRFYPAENHHQKFYLQRHSLIFQEFRDMYPHSRELWASTAAARVNGVLGGFGSRERLKQIIPLLGLSDGAGDYLLDRVRGR